MFAFVVFFPLGRARMFDLSHTDCVANVSQWEIGDNAAALIPRQIQSSARNIIANEQSV